MCNVVWNLLDNIVQGSYLYNVVPKVLRQHWSRFFPWEYCLEPLGQQCIYLFNVSLWLRYNFYEENNLCNAVLTMLGQHYIGILSSQCCLNTFETTLHQKTMFNVDQGRTNMFSKENKLYNVVLICLSQHFTRKLSLKYWPTVHKQLCT